MKKPDRNAWLAGNNTACNNPPDPPPGSPWRLVLLGAPGVGKGTQAELICERLGVCHLSTGDILRAADSRGGGDASPALQSALFNMHHGALVPDSLMMELVAERCRCLRCRGGFVLDGYPRSVAQAEALDELMGREGVALDAVIYYDLPTHEIVDRLGGRLVCPECKVVYHATMRAPHAAGRCDNCGRPLVRRADDLPASVITRQRVYEETTRPLLDWYSRKGLLITVDAHGTPDEIYVRTWSSPRSPACPV